MFLDHDTKEDISVADVMERDALGSIILTDTLHLAREPSEIGSSVQVGVAFEGQRVVPFLKHQETNNFLEAIQNKITAELQGVFFKLHQFFLVFSK